MKSEDLSKIELLIVNLRKLRTLEVRYRFDLVSKEGGVKIEIASDIESEIVSVLRQYYIRKLKELGLEFED